MNNWRRFAGLFMAFVIAAGTVMYQGVPVYGDDSTGVYDQEAADTLTYDTEPAEAEQADGGVDDPATEEIFCDASDLIIQNGGFPDREKDAFEADRAGDESAMPSYDSLGTGYKFPAASAAAAEAISNWNGTDNEIVVNVSSYNMTGTDLHDYSAEVINTHPEFFYMSGHSSALTFGDRMLTVSFDVDKRYTRDDVNKFNSAVDRIVSGADRSWTDLQKVLYIHDYLAMNVTYDLSLNNHNAYQAIVEGCAVCQGYALACTYLLNRIDSDFDCEMVTSNACNHAWNVLTLDGIDYYMDVTHDDPTGAYEFNCRYKFFLVSEATLYADANHRASDWKDSYGNSIQGRLRTDNKYETLPWKNMGSSMPMFGSTGFYYANNIDLYRYNFINGISQKLNSYNTGYSSYPMAGLASYEDYIVFTLPKTILILDRDGIKRDEYPSKNTSGYICGVRVDGNTIKYDVRYNNSYIRYEQIIEGKVPDAPVKVTGVKLSTDMMSMQTGDSAQLKATVSPADADDKTVTWTSSRTAVATVDKNGTVNAISEGEAVITVKTVDGGYTASARITVKAKSLNAPTASTGSGEVEAGLNVLLGCDTYGAYIYYTVDGSDPIVDASGNPGASAILYTEPISVMKDMTIKAVAFKKGYRTSGISVYRYTVMTGWGGIDENTRKMFDDISMVPHGMWYVFDGENGYRTKGGDTAISFDYTGEPITFGDSIRAYYGTKKLVEGRDYLLKFKNNVNARTLSADNAPFVTVKGTGNYSNSVDFKFAISPADINRAKISSAKVMAVREGDTDGYRPPVVTYGDTVLSEGVDYDLSYYAAEDTSERRIERLSDVISTPGAYRICISGHEGSNYAGTSNETILLKVVSKDKTKVIRMDSADVTGMPRPEWSEAGINLADLFDNRTKASTVSVKYGSDTLKYGDDFTIDEIEKGTPVVKLSAGDHDIVLRGTERDGDKSYTGDKVVTLKINGINASGVKIACLNRKPQYTGRPITINDLYKKDSTGYKEVTLYTESNGKRTVLTGDDYEIITDGLRATGSSTLEFRLKNGYTGRIKKVITVKPYNLTNDERKNVKVTFSKADKTYEYCKSGVKPQVSVKAGDLTLKEGIDYTVSYKNNKSYPLIKGAEPTVVVKGKGNYKGKTVSTFIIEDKPIEKVRLAASDKMYRRDAGPGYFKVYPKVMDGDKALTKGKDIDRFNKSDFMYYYAGTNNEINDNEVVAPGKVIEVRLSVTCPSESRYKGAAIIRGYYRIIEEDKLINKAEVEVKDPDKFVFADGTALVPLKSDLLSVKVNGKTLADADYAIVSATNNRFVGTATVVLEGRGDYGGSKRFKFKINKRFL